ncbi:MAG: 4-hydroxy-tetrahydrodipicolinate reductase [Rhodospirillales bacterium]|nr:4-hydroxy-tetrahydrodipicolinate reductase [Rhodospirillales bacterium]
MSKTRIGVVGCAGRMGRMLIAEIAGSGDCIVAGGVEAPSSPNIGRDLGELAGIEPLGLAVGGDRAALFAASDVVIDFTVPAASVAHASLAAERGCALVIGTTGLDTAQAAALQAAAKRTPIVWAPNMSLGVTLMTDLVEHLARRLDAEFDIEILEMHHRHKIDAPSGTALALGQAAAAGRGIALDGVAQRTRDGQTGPRRSGDIGFATLRGGDVVGEHTVIFAAEGERVEISHRATSRRVFARGALRAARWVVGKPPALYDMKDVLALR